MNLQIVTHSRPSGQPVYETRCLRCTAVLSETLAEACWQCGVELTLNDWLQARRLVEQLRRDRRARV